MRHPAVILAYLSAFMLQPYSNEIRPDIVNSLSLHENVSRKLWHFKRHLINLPFFLHFSFVYSLTTHIHSRPVSSCGFIQPELQIKDLRVLLSKMFSFSQSCFFFNAIHHSVSSKTVLT